MRTGQGIEFSGLKLSYVDTLNNNKLVYMLKAKWN